MKIEPAGTCGARIDDEAAACVSPNDRAMRVAEHHNVIGVAREKQFRRGPPELVAVTDVQRQPAERNDAFPTQHRIAWIIDVPVDRFDRRDRQQCLEYARSPDVTGVNDHVDAGENPPYVGPPESVRVGDDADHVYFPIHASFGNR